MDNCESSQQRSSAITPDAVLTRRDSLRLLAVAPFAVRAMAAAASPPNIVIMLADDLGYGDLGFTGCPDIRTPNLDRFSAEGVQFTRAYCNGSVCSPTRAALLTGQYQQRNDMDSVILVRQRERGLAAKATLLPQVLKSIGYTTGLIGKWHLGFKPEFLPTRRGFDEFKGFLAGNIDYFNHTDRRGELDFWDGEKPLKDDRYMSDFIAEESMSFIERHRSQRFFLYVAFNAVHDPFQGPGDRASAGNAEISLKKNRTRAVYRTMTESLDFNAGRILARLKNQGLNENTVVFFMSDNGGIADIGHNLPFSGHKGQLWEGGIRTPFVARWPGHFPAGSKRSELATTMDLLPTCAALAGAKLPTGKKIDGFSLLPACRGKGEIRRDALYFHAGTQHAMMRGDLKYLKDADGTQHIFDLAADPSEKNDLAKERQAEMETMRKDYQRWMLDVYSGKLPIEKNQTAD